MKVSRNIFIALFVLSIANQALAQSSGNASSGSDSSTGLSGLAVTTMRNLNRLLPATTSATNSTTSVTPSIENPNTVVKVVTPLADTPKTIHPFERLVEQSLGSKLKIFGQNYFSNDALYSNSYAVPGAINVPADYTVAPGDELNIHAFGKIDLDLKTVVDNTGSIVLPQVGVLTVAGVSLRDLSKHIKTALSQYYKGFDVSVSLGQLRGAQVYVTGFAQRPGSYSVNALSTVVNALFASGGPNGNGSLRDVELRRNGRTVAKLDLYRFLIFGDKSADVRIQSGDVIYIPPIKNLASVAGTVNGPAIFEIRPDTHLSELLQYAGGVVSNTAGQRLTLERQNGDKGREVMDLTLNDKTLAMRIQDGDMLVVLPQTPRFNNAVTLRGNVAMPIRYQWKAGMHISDLIPNQQALISPTFWLQRDASIKVDLLNSAQGNPEVKQTFPEINWEYATLERINMGALTTSLIPFNLGKVVLNHDAKEDIQLEPGDIITIFAKRDFRIPIDQLSKYVRIEGEVQRAGIYSVSPGETFRDALNKAGGLTPNAYVYGTELRRETVRAQQQKRMDESINRLEQDFQHQAMSRSRSVTTTEEATTLPYETQAMKGLIERMKEIKAKGRVVLEVQPNDTTIAAYPALSLEDNDVIYVPPVPATVEVVGGVYNENSFLYKPNKSLDNYLDQAGGLLPKADRGRIYVLRPDGSVKATSSREVFNSTDIQPGDTIAVPEEFDKISIVKGLKDWSQIMYQFILGVGGLILLKGI